MKRILLILLDNMLVSSDDTKLLLDNKTSDTGLYTITGSVDG